MRFLPKVLSMSLYGNDSFACDLQRELLSTAGNRMVIDKARSYCNRLIAGLHRTIIFEWSQTCKHLPSIDAGRGYAQGLPEVPAAGAAAVVPCMLRLDGAACEASIAWLVPRVSILVGWVRRCSSSLVPFVMSAKERAVHRAPS